MAEGAPLRELGILLLVAGVVLAAGGLLLVFADRIPGLGRLPGDLLVRRERFTLWIPITTCLVLSLLLTLLLNLFRR